MKNVRRILNNNGGSIVSDLLIFTLVVIFVLLPIFSAVFEQYILLLKGKAIRDAIDMTNLAAYNAMKIPEKSESKITATVHDIDAIFKPMIALNMNLNSDLTPKENSIVDETVKIVNITVYPKGMSFPVTCPEGSTICRPTVHSVIKVSIKPALYWNIYKLLTGAEGDGIKDYMVHRDTELPYNNLD